MGARWWCVRGEARPRRKEAGRWGWGRGGPRSRWASARRRVTWRGSGLARAWRRGGGSGARGGHVTRVGAAAAAALWAHWAGTERGEHRGARGASLPSPASPQPPASRGGLWARRPPLPANPQRSEEAVACPPPPPHHIPSPLRPRSAGAQRPLLSGGGGARPSLSAVGGGRRGPVGPRGSALLLPAPSLPPAAPRAAACPVPPGLGAGSREAVARPWGALLPAFLGGDPCPGLWGRGGGQLRPQLCVGWGKASVGHLPSEPRAGLYFRASSPRWVPLYGWGCAVSEAQLGTAGSGLCEDRAGHGPCSVLPGLREPAYVWEVWQGFALELGHIAFNNHNKVVCCWYWRKLQQESRPRETLLEGTGCREGSGVPWSHAGSELCKVQ